MGGSKRPTRYLERPQRIELELWMSVSVPFFYDTFNQLLVATAHFEICAEECSVEAQQLKRIGVEVSPGGDSEQLFRASDQTPPPEALSMLPFDQPYIRLQFL